ncbi:MAG: polymerase III subunit beta protein [candidate division TM6 bacterium GW2011_GWF2_28_16]|nr:MAG: polymerase III subunit beta protein [candidate division TM6 bacterium GW2011_GWF2_28_16]
MDGKFIVTQKDVLSLLTAMQPICSKKTALDVTESIMFQVTSKELILKATDLQISLQSSMGIESNFTENFDFLISGKRIFDLVKEMEGDIEFNFLQNQLHLKSDGVKLLLNIRPADDFPQFPERIENLMQINSTYLVDLLNKVAFLIPQNNSNAALNGMLLEFNDNGMLMVTTDGHRLAKIFTDKYKLHENQKWLLPKRAVLELKKILEETQVENIFLGTCGNQLVFSGASFNFFTKLISDPFPHYEPILEREGFRAASLDKQSFLKTLKRTSCFLSGQFVSTSFKFQPGKLAVNLQSKEVGKIDESLLLNDFDGQEVATKFYSPYLLAGLQVFNEDAINFFIHDDSRPIIFEADVKDKNYKFTYIVMPVSAEQ